MVQADDREDTIDSPSKSKPLEAKNPPTGRTIIPMENMNSTLYAFMTGSLRAGAIWRRRFCQDVEYEYPSGDDTITLLIIPAYKS